MHRRFLETELRSMPPSNENNKLLYDASFDANMLIVLIALVSSLILALGLNTIAKCFIRCRERFPQEMIPGTRRFTGRGGLKRRDLDQIPVTVYGSGENIPMTECPICLGEFENGDRVRMLPICNHGFHMNCIDTWLVSHSSCPICRHSVLEREQQAAGDGLPENEAGQRGDVVVVVEQAS